MNWIRENKFLTGFIAVMVIGVGVLGYLLYSAWSTYSDVSDQYTEKAGALHQLQIRVPYPDDANLAKYSAERDDFKDATHALADDLSKMVLPVEELSQSAFQDRLRETQSNVVAKADKQGVKLPAGFAMDFNKYLTSPPAAEAAGPLGRQLAALEIATDILLDEHVDSITSLTRTPLPQEGGAGGPGAGGGPGGGGPGGGGPGGGRRGGGRRGGGGGGLVENYPFEIRFTSSQPVFQKVLNDFAASDKQFFITRTLIVENTNSKPVAKDQAAATPPPAAATTGTDSGAPPAAYLTFIVGTEKLNVAMQVEVVAFNPPEKSARPGAAPSR
jgi:uncharacterized membrane protein YgcG